MYAANFQAITFAQATGGYLDGAGTPNASLATALKTADERLGNFLTTLESAGRLNSTLVLVGSKQGQGPINPNTLKVINPTHVMNAAGVPVAFFNGEDGGIVSHSPNSWKNTAAKKCQYRCISRIQQTRRPPSKTSCRTAVSVSPTFSLETRSKQQALARNILTLECRILSSASKLGPCGTTGSNSKIMAALLLKISTYHCWRTILRLAQRMSLRW